MGTNYYLEVNVCDHCKRPEEKLHIGKSSFGWCFSLHVKKHVAEYGNIPTNLDGWVKLWHEPNSRIVDEDGDVVSPEDMLKIITDRESYATNGEFKWRGYDSEVTFHRMNRSERGPFGLLRHNVDYEHCIRHGEGTFDYIVGVFS